MEDKFAKGVNSNKSDEFMRSRMINLKINFTLDGLAVPPSPLFPKGKKSPC